MEIVWKKLQKISTVVSIHLITLFVKETVTLYHLSKKNKDKTVCNGFADYS